MVLLRAASLMGTAFPTQRFSLKMSRFMAAPPAASLSLRPRWALSRRSKTPTSLAALTELTSARMRQRLLLNPLYPVTAAMAFNPSAWLNFRVRQLQATEERDLNLPNPGKF